ncbi:MAG: SDR family NAD(P)-dependent oxidoreductase [Candidatus Thorarchaeota archaeon]
MVKYDLTDRVVIITGGSAGLGEQFAYGFAESGAHVVLAARRKKLLDKIVKKVSKDYGVRALAFKADVSKEKEVIDMVDFTVDKLGTVDVLINNAGMYVFKPLLEQTIEDWNKVMDVNLTSAFVASREVARIMIPKKHGSMINISSTFGFGATRFTEVSYYTSKAGMNLLTKALAIELGEHNIRVNGIAPGFFPTAMSIEAMTDKEISKIIKDRTALPMFAENEWIRGAACFLASDDAKYITGHTLAVDGGWMAF